MPRISAHGWLGQKDLTLGSKAVRRFADGQQGILHGKDAPLVPAKSVEIHAGRKALDAADIVEDVLQGLAEIFKRQERPRPRRARLCRP
jgi:hypothetical protein